MEPQRPAEDENARERSWLKALAIACGALTILTLWIGSGRDCLSNPDEAAYTEQADSILAGDDLTVGFVRHFHVRYPRGIDHVEDFYPPGNGALIALSWAVFGRSDFAAAIPSILIACLLLPFLAFLLARGIGASPPFAFACALTVALNELVRDHAFQGLADLPFVACSLGAVVLVMRPSWLRAAAAGAVLGAGFYFKPTALLLLPGLALACPILARTARMVAIGRGGVVVAGFLLVASPWLARNYAEFDGDPLYSGNKHLTATANAPDFEYADIRRVYWAEGEDSVPSMAGSVGRYGLKPIVSRFILHIYQCVVSYGPDIFGFWFLIAVVVLCRSRRVRALLGYIGSFVLALSAVFAIEYRYLMPMIPIAAAIVWTFADRVARSLDVAKLSSGTLLETLGAKVRRRVPGLSAPSWIALALVAVATIPSTVDITRDLVRNKRWFAPLEDWTLRDSALWARDHLPADATVMSQEALRFRYYSRRRTVNTPFDEPDHIQAVVDHYGVDYIVTNPSGAFAALANHYLSSYLRERQDGWTRVVPDGADFAVYVRKGADPPR